jgi:hypothetical protein
MTVDIGLPLLSMSPLQLKSPVSNEDLPISGANAYPKRANLASVYVLHFSHMGPVVLSADA